jgi:hypothetical protein
VPRWYLIASDTACKAADNGLLSIFSAEYSASLHSATKYQALMCLILQRNVLVLPSRLLFFHQQPAKRDCNLRMYEHARAVRSLAYVKHRIRATRESVTSGPTSCPV